MGVKNKKPYPENILDNLDNPSWKGEFWNTQNLKDVVRAAIEREREEREPTMTVDQADNYAMKCIRESDPLSADLVRLAESGAIRKDNRRWVWDVGVGLVMVDARFWPKAFNNPRAAVDAALKEIDLQEKEAP